MSELSWIRRYIYRNPYTGQPVFDEDAALESEEFRKAFGEVWSRGYDSGFDDGVCDSSVETQSRNPFL